MSFAPEELRKFTDAGRAISDAAGVAFEDWARGASGVILKEWTANIAVPPTARIEDRARGRANLHLGISRSQNPSFSGNQYQISVNTGGRKGQPGVVWTRTKKRKWQVVGNVANGTFIPANRHFTAEKWGLMNAGAQRIAQLAPELIAAGKSAAGLARQSVIQIADALGIALETVRGGIGIGADGIAKARAAVASDGRIYQNGTGTHTKTGTAFEIEMIDSYSRNREAKVQEALETAIRLQTLEFERNLSAKVFDSARKTAKAYPYLEVT